MHSKSNLFLFGLFWGAIMGAVVAVDLVFRQNWHVDTALLQALFPFCFGGFAGGMLALKLSTRHKRTGSVQFCKLFVSLIVLTLLTTHIYLFVEHQIFFVETPFMQSPRDWLGESFVAYLGSVVLFVLTALRPLLPWGILAAAIFAYPFSRGWWPARR